MSRCMVAVLVRQEYVEDLDCESTDMVDDCNSVSMLSGKETQQELSHTIDGPWVISASSNYSTWLIPTNLSSVIVYHLWECVLNRKNHDKIF